MKHSIKRILMILFITTLVVSSVAVYTSTAYAFTTPMPLQRWSYLTIIRAGMDVNDRNIAKITVTVGSDIFDTNKVVAKCELQQLDGSWKTIKTWTEEHHDSAIMYNKEWAIAKNYSYRLKVTGYAYRDSILLESATEYFNYGYYQ